VQCGWEPSARFESPHVAVVQDQHPADVGMQAFQRGLPLHELAAAGTSLEALFLRLTSGSSQQVEVGP
jgi:hypothetical protein